MGLLRGRRGLYLGAFLTDLFGATGQFAIPLLAIGLGASELQLGLLGTSGIVYFVGCVGMGALSDRWGRKRLILLACALLVIIYPLLGVMRSFGALLLMSCILGGSMSLFWPALMAWLAEQPDERSLSSSVGIMNVCWSIGFGLAPLMAGFAADQSLWLPLVIASAGMLLVAMVLLMTKRGHQVRREPAHHEPDHREPPHPLARTFLLVAWAANFSLIFSSSLSRILLPKVTTDMLLNVTVLGRVLTSAGIGRTLMFVILGRFSGWAYKVWPIVLVQCGAIVGMLLVFRSSSPTVWAIGLGLVGVGVGLTYHSSLFYTLAYSPARMGLRTGLHEGILGSAMWLGPLLGGVVARMTGDVKSAWLLGAAVPLLGMIAPLYLAISRARRSRE